MIAATLFFTALNSLVRHLDHLPTFQLVFFRSLGTALCCAAVLWQQKISPIGKQPKWLLARGAFGFVALALYYKAIQVMPLGTAVGLRYLAPFFAAILAVIFLREKMRPLQWLFFASAFLGVMLVKGFDPRITTIGLITILVCAFFTGVVYVIIRKLGNTEHPVVVVWYFMFISCVLGFILCIKNWVPPTRAEWYAVLAMGIVGFIAQVFMTRALQMAEARIVAPFKYVEVVATVWVGWLIFGEYQTHWALLGIAVIIVSLVLNLWAS